MNQLRFTVTTNNYFKMTNRRTNAKNLCFVTEYFFLSGKNKKSLLWMAFLKSDFHVSMYDV